MTTQQNLLLAIDASDASRRAVEHVGRRVDGRGDVTILLLHVIGPMPTELLEHGGASDAAEEERLDAELRAAQDRWFAEERARSQTLFGEARDRLLAEGVDPDAIRTACVESIPEDDLAQVIAHEAREAGCDVIVVGRRSYPWFGELFHQHVGDALARKGTDVEVEVV